jgi:hypothetical protein
MDKSIEYDNHISIDNKIDYLINNEINILLLSPNDKKIKKLHKKYKEPENILINLRDEVDNELEKEQINQELLTIYTSALNDGSIHRSELLKKIIELEKKLKDKRNISFTYILKELKVENYYLNDCLVDHISNQRNKILSLEHKNRQLQLKNDNPSFIIEASKNSNHSFLFIGLLISVFSIILIIEYLNYPTIDLIKNFNMDVFMQTLKELKEGAFQNIHF